MDPISLLALGASQIAGIGMASTAMGSGLAAVGSVVSGIGSASMYGYQSAIASMNAKIMEQNAQYALEAGEKERRQSGMRSSAEIGRMIAGQGASGVDVNSGSSAEVQGSQRMIARENQDIISENASRRSVAYRNEAEQYKAQSSAYKTAAGTSMASGIINAGSSLLSGVGSVSSKWLEASRYGLFQGEGNPIDLGYATSYTKNG